MNEIPAMPQSAKAETPMPDPNVFLLRHDNWDFLHGQRANPVIIKRLTNTAPLFVAGLAIVALIYVSLLLIFVMTGGNFALVAVGLIFFVVAFLGIRLRQMRNLRPQQGIVLQGEVIRAEKIRIGQGRYEVEKIGVRYRFADSGGVVHYGESEGESNATSDKMAPPPGTPVRVWYNDEGNSYLL
jgi:membrane protein implicated in regulation of membrane protease activity